MESLAEASGEDYNRNYREHFNSPIFLPVTKLLRRVPLKGKRLIVGPCFRGNPFASGLAHAFPWRRAELRKIELHQSAVCFCSGPNDVILNLQAYVPPGRPEAVTFENELTQQDLRRCIEVAKRSCPQTIEESFGDGFLIGFVGFTPNP